MAHQVAKGEQVRGTQDRFDRFTRAKGGTEPTLALLKHGSAPRTHQRRLRVKRVKGD